MCFYVCCVRVYVCLSLMCQTKVRYSQTTTDGMCLCPERPRQKVQMSRLSCPYHRALQKKFVHSNIKLLLCSCPDFVRQCPDYHAFNRAFRPVVVNARTPPPPPHALISVRAYPTSVWDLNLKQDCSH